MPETNFSGYQFSDSKIRFEPTDIRGEGGLLYPRLVIPLTMDLKPVKDGGQVIPYIVWSVRARLAIENDASKIADGVGDLSPYRMDTHPNTHSTTVEFVLDPIRAKYIEEKRTGDLKIRLDFNVLVGQYQRLHFGNPPRYSDFITGFVNHFMQLSAAIPHSHWVNKVLPELGKSEYFIVELPKGAKVLEKAWAYIERAEAAFADWNTKGIWGNCREAGELLDASIKQKCGDASFSYKERWRRAYDNFKRFASLDLHLEDVRKSPQYKPEEVMTFRSDAEHLLLVTKSLIKFAEELVSEEK